MRSELGFSLLGGRWSLVEGVEGEENKEWSCSHLDPSRLLFPNQSLPIHSLAQASTRNKISPQIKAQNNERTTLDQAVLVVEPAVVSRRLKIFLAPLFPTGSDVLDEIRMMGRLEKEQMWTAPGSFRGLEPAG